eukprot:scaffold14574_cov120-Isochrysis_galbana.AAC.11
MPDAACPRLEVRHIPFRELLAYAMPRTRSQTRERGSECATTLAASCRVCAHHWPASGSVPSLRIPAHGARSPYLHIFSVSRLSARHCVYL